jgi:hypothetical protein
MCGITGFSRADGRSSICDPRRLLKSALLSIENRGTDATGFAWTDDDGLGWYWKKAVAAHEAVFAAPFPTRHVVTAIGHTRWATQGSKHKNENNHPVIDEGVMLVHNGIITNDREIMKWLDPEYPPKAEVDTAAFAALLAHPEEVFATHPTELLAMVAGSAAFAWIMPDNPEELHLAKTTNERPLTIGWTRLGDLIMSSTPTTLANTAEMAGIKVRRFRELDEGTYLRVVAGEIVEEASFRPCRSYQYNNKTTTGASGKSSTTTKGTPQSGEPGHRVVTEATTYVAGHDGVYRPLNAATRGAVASDAVKEDCTPSPDRGRAVDTKEFWKRIEGQEEFYDRIWNGEDVNDILDELWADDNVPADDPVLELALDYKHGGVQFGDGPKPKLTVIAGGKGTALEPYDQDTIKGKTQVDQAQEAYEAYLSDMDGIDWYEVAPRRGWKERKQAEEVAADIADYLSREDR